MHLERLNVGVLAAWSKSFNCANVVGQDVVKLLNAALRKRGIHVDVVAVLNDTTG
jgi:hexokinase